MPYRRKRYAKKTYRRRKTYRRKKMMRRNKADRGYLEKITKAVELTVDAAGNFA